MSYILPLYDNDEYTLHIFEVIGKEVDELVSWVSDFENQPYPQFATFTLPYWEESLGLEVDEKLTVEHRRNRIITKLSTYFPITRQRLEMIASSAAGVPVTIEDFVNAYTFRVVLEPRGLVNLLDLINEVNETKPAHLSYLLTQNLNSTIFIAPSTVCGEEITVYPWQETSLETKGTAYLGTASRSIEKISIYPQ